MLPELIKLMVNVKLIILLLWNEASEITVGWEISYLHVGKGVIWYFW